MSEYNVEDWTDRSLLLKLPQGELWGMNGQEYTELHRAQLPPSRPTRLRAAFIVCDMKIPGVPALLWELEWYVNLYWQPSCVVRDGAGRERLCSLRGIQQASVDDEDGRTSVVLTYDIYDNQPLRED